MIIPTLVFAFGVEIKTAGTASLLIICRRWPSGWRGTPAGERLPNVAL